MTIGQYFFIILCILIETSGCLTQLFVSERKQQKKPAVTNSKATAGITHQILTIHGRWEPIIFHYPSLFCQKHHNLIAPRYELRHFLCRKGLMGNHSQIIELLAEQVHMLPFLVVQDILHQGIGRV